jgi:16S rRNA (cytosine967-C5)-methyltransferase
VLRLGLYQLHFLDQIPDRAAIHTTVELAKANGLGGLAKVVNGMLRQYQRQRVQGDPLAVLEGDPSHWGERYSFPDWLVSLWCGELGPEETQALLTWFNRPPSLDLRLTSRCDRPVLLEQFQQQGVTWEEIEHLPQAIRLTGHRGAIRDLPGYQKGWWVVQDASAQLVSLLLDPQPGETIIDACAAPGGKTCHIADLMGDRGTVWAGDRSEKRLKKIQENADRLGLSCIRYQAGESQDQNQWQNQADRVLVDAPCSGLGTVHKRPDLRWNQSPQTLEELQTLQGAILASAATWVKPGGVLVYATCTLHHGENERQIERFLQEHSQWELQDPSGNFPLSLRQQTPWLTLLPHRHSMDGFFMAKLYRRV